MKPRRHLAAPLLLAVVIVVVVAAPGSVRSLVSGLGRSGAATPTSRQFVGGQGTVVSVARRVGQPAPIIFLDPGHGGVNTGAIGTTESGMPVEEKTLTLAIAQRTAASLRAAGFGVVLSRSDDSLPGLTPGDETPDGSALTPAGVLHDLQRRIDAANASGANLLLSIHLNWFNDPSISGAETYYDPARPFAAQSERFAGLVQQDLIAALRAAGYSTPDRGVVDDTTLQAEQVGALPDSYNHLVLLGPAIPGTLRASDMPGALSESLFLSHPAEATAAADPAMQELIAGAFTQAVEDYFAGKQSSE